MALEFVKLFKGASPVSQVGNYGFFQLSTQSAGGGGEVEFSRVFGENSPAVISQVGAEIAKNNMTSSQVAETYGWNIGDTISYQLTTGENVEMRITGFNHDTLSDGSGKAGITLEMVKCLDSVYAPMNNINTNAGGYPACDMRNTTLPSIKATLPQEWQDIIKKVDKKSANGSNANYSEIVTTSEDLFLLSEIEVYGAVYYAQDGANEGSVYEYWNGKDNWERSKTYKTFGSTTWALRSSSVTSAMMFCSVYSSGQSNSGYKEANSNHGVSFAFCVGSASDSTGGGESGGTVVEEVQNDTGTTLNITSTNYTETLNEQNGYTLEIGG